MSQQSQTQGNRIWTYVGGLAAVGAAIWLAISGLLNSGIDPLDFDARVEHVMRSTPLVDGHNDLPYLLRLELKNKIYDAERFTFDTSMSEIPSCDFHSS